MSRKAPAGFYILGFVAAMLGALMVFLLTLLDPPDGFREGLIVLRAGTAGLAVLAAVATEALWFRRRWAYPATLALAIAVGAVVAVLLPGFGGAVGLVPALAVLALFTGAMASIVLYVRACSRALFGIPRPARPPVRPNQAPWW
jgi:hypothetical protein